jgi:hypothetical protein
MTDPHRIADLELRIDGAPGAWQLSMRLTRPGDQADLQRGPFATGLDPELLRSHDGDPAAYGAALSAMLFVEAAAVVVFAEARAVVLNSGGQLRVRLHLPPSLQHLRWETLADPRSGRPLALEGRLLLLSRYLSGDDYQPVHVGPERSLRTCVAVAAAKNLDQFGLSLIDAAVEHQRATSALAQPDRLELLGGSAAPATWAALQAQLNRGCDILYLVAHGALVEQRPILYLEHDDGTAAVIEGALLVDCLRGLGAQRPCLVVLASCESAGDGYADALAALGPQLALAGVPAVLAMQGRISLETSTIFQARFFEQLLLTGLVDQATGEARFAVSQRDDWWMPVLYTRLRDGRLWGEVEEPQAQYVEQRRLDAAMPAKSVVDKPSELWVQICLPASPGFRKDLPSQTRYGDEITAADVHEGTLPLLFPQGPDGKPQPLKVRVELTAPEFTLSEPSIETVLIPRQDTARLTFNLTPNVARRRSTVTVTIKQLQPDSTYTVAGSTSVETSVLSRGAGLLSRIAWNLSSIGLIVGMMSTGPRAAGSGSTAVKAGAGSQVTVDISKLIDFSGSTVMGSISFGDVVGSDSINRALPTQAADQAPDPLRDLPILRERVATARNVDEETRDEVVSKLDLAYKALARGDSAKARQRVDEALALLQAINKGYMRSVVRKLEALRDLL